MNQFNEIKDVLTPILIVGCVDAVFLVMNIVNNQPIKRK